MNAFAVVIFFAAAAAPKQSAARNARQLSSTYIQLDKLTAADAAAGDDFGCPVAIDGDTVVVGASATTTAARAGLRLPLTSDGAS